MKNPDPDSTRVLVVDSGRPDEERVRSILTRANLSCVACSDIHELCDEIRMGAGNAVVSEEALNPEAMNVLVEQLSGQGAWSDFPLVILFRRMGRSADAQLRMLDLLEPLGNVSLLHQKVAPITLVSAVRSALRARQRQYEIRRLLNEQEQAVRERDRFLSLLAHEMRNPLSVIRNASCILEGIQGNSILAHEQRAAVLRQTSALARVVDDTVDFFKILAGRVHLQRETLDLVHLTSQCLSHVRDEAGKKKLHLSLRNECPTLVVRGDARRLGQVITHLLRNAVDTASPGQHVQVILASEEHQATVTFRGGMSRLAPEKLAELFRPNDNAHCPVDDGLHLGLALSGSLIGLHVGSVVVARSGPRQELELVVRLPLMTVVPAPVQEAFPTSAAKTGSLHVLVVEDNDDGRETLRLLLQLWGHQVETAADGFQGIRKALARRPEVGIIDIGLPGLDGYEVARQLRASLGNAMFLIAMTGFGQPHDHQQALEAGFDAHLVKPVNPSTLQEVLAASGRK